MHVNIAHVFIAVHSVVYFLECYSLTAKFPRVQAFTDHSLSPSSLPSHALNWTDVMPLQTYTGLCATVSSLTAVLAMRHL